MPVETGTCGADHRGAASLPGSARLRVPEAGTTGGRSCWMTSLNDCHATEIVHTCPLQCLPSAFARVSSHAHPSAGWRMQLGQLARTCDCLLALTAGHATLP